MIHPISLRIASLAIALTWSSLSLLKGQTINVDLNSSAANNYSGSGIAPGDSGTTWNALTVTSSSLTSVTIPGGSVKDSQGNTLAGVTITLANAAGTGINRFDTTANTTPNPTALMRDYTFTGTYNVSVTGLAEGTYEFWFFGHGDQASQAGSVAISSGNGGGGGATANSSLGRDLINGGAGVSYVYSNNLTVDSGGVFQFTVTNYLNGFQLRKTSSGPPPPVDNRKAIFGDAGENPYTGTAVAPGTGSVWNQLPGNTGSNNYTITNVLDASGNTLAGATISVASTDNQVRWFASDSPGNPNPLNLMRDYFYNGTFTISMTGVPQGNYFLYVFAHGNSTNQNSTVTINAANGGGSGVTDGVSVDNRNLFAPAAEGKSYLKFNASVGAAGTLSFVCGPALTSQGYFTGFQLVPYPDPVITSQPPPSPSVTVNSSINIPVTATGEGTPTYQWRKGGVNLNDGPTGNGSTFSGTTTATLSLANAQYADAGDYDVVITNPGGSTTSESSVLAVTATALAPSILTHPAHQTATSGGSAAFSVIANGTSPLTYQWFKGSSALTDGTTPHGSIIAGANLPTLTISNITVADADTYQVVVTNSVNSATSNNANLVVKPVIVTPPAATVLSAGSNHVVSVVADAGSDSPEGLTYVWKRDGTTVTNGSSYAGATTANLAITGISPSESGYYTVAVSNSAGSITTSQVYVGVASTQSVTFAPGNNASGLAIDQQLRLVFPSMPRIGRSGTITIRDAADDSVLETIDISQFLTYAPGNTTAVIPNARIRTVQGSQSATATTAGTTTYYYMPIAIYGNEAWITLTNRFSYGRTYYVTMSPGALLDSTNAAYPGISDPFAWRFSTKASGPATPTASTGPTTITVGLDGTGDFATLQGAFDWIPVNNTLPRTVSVLPGDYYDSATLGVTRNFVKIVGAGNNRTDARVVYPYPFFRRSDGSDFTCGSLRIEASDVTVRNLTLDNLVYYAYSPTGRPEDTNTALVGAINTLASFGKRLVFDDLLIKGGQDTFYQVGGIAYFFECEVWGSVDFIYGPGLGVFDQCDIVQIRTQGAPIGAPNTPEAQPYGQVFLNCRFPRALIADGYPYDVNAASCTFMRPWGQDGRTAIINCQIGSQMSTSRWGDWSGRENTCHAVEYGTTLIGGGSVALGSAYWNNTIDPDYTSASMSPTGPLLAPPGGHLNRVPVSIDPNDYTLAAIFGHPYFNLAGWMPSTLPRITSQPASQTVDAGTPVNLNVAATGMPVPSYQWFKNGSLLDGETSATLGLGAVSSAAAGTYTVEVTNTAGTVESSEAVLIVNATDPYTDWAESHFGVNAATDGAPENDFDHDGLANEMEFFLAGDPKSGTTAGILPTASRSTSPAGALVFSFKRANAAENLVWSVEFSTSLNNPWNTAVHGQGGVVIEESPVNAELDQITVTIPATGDRIFARLRLD